MPSFSRVEVVGHPHHIIQRGNRRQKAFFSDYDKKGYLKILRLQSEIFGLKVWAYCLMDNHVHLIVVPEQEGCLTKAIGETHRLYTRMVNFREGWSGYLWHGRFKSYVLDERYLFEAVRYVELNPVRAGIVNNPEQYEFSSAKAHVQKRRDDMLSPFYLEQEVEDWSGYLKEGISAMVIAAIEKSEQTGRPLGNGEFLLKLEQQLGRTLGQQKRGPKKRIRCVSEIKKMVAN